MRAMVIGMMGLGLAGCVGAGVERAPAVPVATVQSQALPPVGPATAPSPAASATPAPPTAAAPQVAAAPAFTPMTPQDIAGEWTTSDRQGSAQCRLTLGSVPRGSGPARAEAQGCSSDELVRVAGWQSRGVDIMLVDGRGAPLILLRPTSRNRYEGTGLSREAFTMTR